MTTQFDVPVAVPDGDDVPRGLTWWGVRTVAQLELRQRVRSTRWKIALLVWVIVVGGVTALVSGAVSYFGGTQMPREDVGATVFGLVLFFVLFLGLLVAPTLSATSVNGDRAAGTLATLQVTTLSAADLAVGKLVAAWLAALAFLAASLPFLAWGLALGGTAVVVAIGTVVLLALILAVVCAVGLAFSALTARTSGSAVLTYLTVAGLSVGTLIAFGLSAPLVTRTDEVRVYDVAADYDWEGDEPPECEWRTQELPVTHLERTAWLLTLNPFVIVADLTPPDLTGSNPMAAISAGIRYAHAGPATEIDQCPASWSGAPEPLPSSGPVWPWGLGVYLLLGAGALAVTIRRLRVPARTLARGTRIA
ncbi:conserved hypothetical protein [Beutenbergia cavernae DSM 12333]|uniref:ABC transporter permease n=1 Tax=Beutenbergia cavernae (strain ATCC BAA-8 / DSM 12333 / CCUG 43141 / JCM 11478 / NBRC 16432 / NCIMB 13614 / HKI 0122) TaxID=471853 RepID=C5BXS0_BEUC1|nr:ABC transporter permease subunit [Beutenbergia cavernae]ACQ78814.1 conserved hypothetical protein [Beutenbergia cavernae DSM 12333]